MPIDTHPRSQRQISNGQGQVGEIRFISGHTRDVALHSVIYIVKDEVVVREVIDRRSCTEREQLDKQRTGCLEGGWRYNRIATKITHSSIMKERSRSRANCTPLYIKGQIQSSAAITRFFGVQEIDRVDSGHRVIAAGSAMDVFWLVFKQRGSWAILGNLSFVG